jgi:hypothetical protein
MAVCKSCGAQVDDGIKFCTSCGKPMAGVRQAARSTSDTGYSYQGQKGWATWSKAQKVWWVILNICTYGIPAILMVLFKFLRKNSSSQNPKVKRGVLVGAALVIVVLVFVTIINVSGVMIKVPDSKIYEVSATGITGKFEDYFKVTGDDVKIKSSDGGTDATIIVTVEKTKGIKKLIDAKIDETLKSKGWSRNDCTINLDDTGLITVSRAKYLATSLWRGTKDHGAIIESLVNMDVGTNKTLRIPLIFEGYSPSASTKKKAVKNLMDLDDLQLNMIFKYEIKNNKVNGLVAVEFN